MSNHEEVQPHAIEAARPIAEVPAEAEAALPSKDLILAAIEWKRQWRVSEGKPPNGYADDLLLTLARAYADDRLREIESDWAAAVEEIEWCERHKSFSDYPDIPGRCWRRLAQQAAGECEMVPSLRIPSALLEGDPAVLDPAKNEEGDRG